MTVRLVGGPADGRDVPWDGHGPIRLALPDPASPDFFSDPTPINEQTLSFSHHCYAVTEYRQGDKRAYVGHYTQDREVSSRMIVDCSHSAPINRFALADGIGRRIDIPWSDVAEGHPNDGGMPYPLDGPAMTSQTPDRAAEALTAERIEFAINRAWDETISQTLEEHGRQMVRVVEQWYRDPPQRFLFLGGYMSQRPYIGPLESAPTPKPKRLDPALLAYSQKVTDAVWERIHSWAAWDEERLGPFRWAWTEEDMGLTERPEGVDPAVEGPYGIPIWRSADGGTSRPAFHVNDATTHHDRPRGKPVDPGDPEQWPASIREWPWSAERPYVPPPGCPCEQCVKLREEAAG